ncbi:MAG TPA: glycosyltransferase [Chloroflexia bacterium]|nr:glycosyltransferase [Chloroflexia bacterium]
MSFELSGFNRARTDVSGGISIVVPAYNAEASVRACIQALLRQQLKEPHEIIVVDDGSTDSTALIAVEYAPRVRVISQPHRGAAAARNTGMRTASGGVVLFTDADCEPVPGWAIHLSKAIWDGATGAKGTYRTRQRSITARFVQAEYESKYRRMARRVRIDFIDTYSAAYRRDVLLAVGGFNETISAVEDQELSFRLASKGHDLRFVPQAVVYHTHAAAPAAYLRKKFSIGYWKVRVAALHPERIISDSHTPPSIKVQMALLAVSIPTLLMAPFRPLARKAFSLCALTFLTTTLPFAAQIARRDPLVALATPLLMLLRATGLLSGFAVGLYRLRRDQ